MVNFWSTHDLSGLDYCFFLELLEIMSTSIDIQTFFVKLTDYNAQTQTSEFELSDTLKKNLVTLRDHNSAPIQDKRFLFLTFSEFSLNYFSRWTFCSKIQQEGSIDAKTILGTFFKNISRPPSSHIQQVPIAWNSTKILSFHTFNLRDNP